MPNASSLPFPKLDTVFDTFIEKSLRYGMFSISDNKGPLVPFVMISVGADETIHRFVDKPYEAALQKAENFVRTTSVKPTFFTVVYSGNVIIGGQKNSAIIAKAFDSKRGVGLVFAQLYRPLSLSIGNQSVGLRIFLGETPNLLSKL